MRKLAFSVLILMLAACATVERPKPLTGADVVASANPGCTMQIAAGLREIGSPMSVLHPVEILDRAYAAESPEAAPAAPDEPSHIPSA